ncbi:MAG: HupE/UreJ family protein [Pseudomonadota bacterium]
MFAAALIALLAALLSAPFSNAHAPEQSYVFLTIDADAMAGKVDFTLGDLNDALGTQIAADGTATRGAIRAIQAPAWAYIAARLELRIDGERLRLQPTDIDSYLTDFGHFVSIGFVAEQTLSVQPESLDITNRLFQSELPGRASLVVIENHWESATLANEAMVSLQFSAANPRQTLSVQPGSFLTGLRGMIALGMDHIATGIDHILFLLTLLLPAVMVRRDGRWQGAESVREPLWRILGIVTAFTVAHSITLSLAMLGVIELPGRLVESIIAASIAVTALHILWPRFGIQSYWIVILFGLFHGFGFAGFLGDMRIPDRYLGWSLFGFNVGVEAGQLVIVAVLVPALLLLRRSTLYARYVMPLAALLLIFVATYWFIERAFDVDIPLGRIVKSLLGIQ